MYKCVQRRFAKHQFKRKYKVGPKAKRTRDGIVFDSQKEARYYDDLKLLKRAGEVLFWLRQIPFYLLGGVKYVCDFQVFYTNGQVEFVDVKGFKTESYKAKKLMVEELFKPVEIMEV